MVDGGAAAGGRRQQRQRLLLSMAGVLCGGRRSSQEAGEQDQRECVSRESMRGARSARGVFGGEAKNIFIGSDPGNHPVRPLRSFSSPRGEKRSHSPRSSPRRRHGRQDRRQGRRRPRRVKGGRKGGRGEREEEEAFAAKEEAKEGGGPSRAGLLRLEHRPPLYHLQHRGARHAAGNLARP